ncbi:hypothetical protein Vafri_4192 [Volvox africanus]|uniref:Uncharacterized protein n=1 Tax=Volvox africanus TaxID=51714 RepID=A0A8J4AUX4_9CHLO|nr:hypothetical protein Vafri_4192 [Volvox africanus]GIL47350.1 hypothetical protein Vafri_4192 [Volvox africanus]GIL47353.1 hypothetical protein Vafri_4192 [Volvox africanus]
MASYWGVSTQQNQALWILFACCLITGGVMLPLGWSKLVPCINAYNKCVDRSVFYESYCRAERDRCGAHWARIWIVGAIMLALAAVPLCVFSCCSGPPSKVADIQPQTAVATQTGAYPQHPAAPSQPYPGTTVIGQPVLSTAIPQNGQGLTYYYPIPPETVQGSGRHPPP